MTSYRQRHGEMQGRLSVKPEAGVESTAWSGSIVSVTREPYKGGVNTGCVFFQRKSSEVCTYSQCMLKKLQYTEDNWGGDYHDDDDKDNFCRGCRNYN